MAIKIKFDSNNKVIEPTVVLANRSGKLFGALPAVNFKFKSGIKDRMIYSELSFNVYENSVTPDIWGKIKDFKLVWIKEWNCLCEIKAETFESDTEKRKFVSGTSLGEAELSRIRLNDTQINTESDISRDDYSPTVLYNPLNHNASLLHRITEKTPHYKNFAVDNTVASMQRPFTFDNQDMYKTLSEIAEACECIIDIECSLNINAEKGNTVKRKITIYDTDTYGEETPIYVSTDNLAKDINYQKESDSVVNCYRIEAGDDLMNAAIRSCNPNGTSYIWNFTDDDYEDMSDKLKNKLSEYNTLYFKYTSPENYTLFSEISGNIKLDFGDDSFSYTNPIALLIMIVIPNINDIVYKYRQQFYKQNTIPVIPNVEIYPSELSTYHLDFAGLTQRQYEIISLQLYLEHNLMPKAVISESTTENEAKKLDTKLTEVSVQNLERTSQWSVTDAVIKMAKVIIDSTQYDISVSDSSTYDSAAKTWTGILTVTKKTDNLESVNTKSLTVKVNEDMTKFIQQQIDIELKKAVDDISVVALFKKNDDEFAAELKKYCLSRLQSFKDGGMGCMDIIDQKSDTTWASTSVAKTIRNNYNNKMDLLTSEIKTRQSEVDICKTFSMLLKKEAKAIQSKLNLKDFLSDLWDEFSSFRRESSFSNSNYISDGLTDAELLESAKELFSSATAKISKLTETSHTITSNIYNLLAMPEFLPIVDYFQLGNWIKCRTDGKLYRLRISEYEIDYDNLDSLNVTFSDTRTFSDSSDILQRNTLMGIFGNKLKRVINAYGSILSLFDKRKER